MVDPDTHYEDKTLEHYSLLRKLGDGTFGIGYLAKDQQSGQLCCVKVFKEMDPASDKTFRAEVEAGQTGLNHPNVLRLLGAGRSQVIKGGESGDDVFYIVSEIASNGEAFDYVEAAGGLPEPVARQYFGQLISAVDYIHKKGIAHRDLKLENCFLNEDVNLKVADFGMQKIFAGPEGKTLSTKLGTPNYMAPELLTGGLEAYDGPPVDVFACGVILFIMVYGKFPFGEANDVYYRRLQKDPLKAMTQRKIEANEEFLDLVVGMTQHDPAQRYTLHQVKHHAWSKGQTENNQSCKEHYYSLCYGAKAANQLTYDKMQADRAKFAASIKIERGTHENYCGPSPLEVASWKDLEYKPFTGTDRDSGHTGFMADTIGPHLFIALWEYLAEKKDVVPEIDQHYWKMTFTLDEPLLEEVELEEDESEDEVKTHKVIIVAQVKDKGEGHKPRYFMNFRRKQGQAAIFSRFVKDAMAQKLQMFCEKEI